MAKIPHVCMKLTYYSARITTILSQIQKCSNQSQNTNNTEIYMNKILKKYNTPSIPANTNMQSREKERKKKPYL